MTPTIRLLLGSVAKRLLPGRAPLAASSSSSSSSTSKSSPPANGTPDVWDISDEDASSVASVGGDRRGRRRVGGGAAASTSAAGGGGGGVGSFRVLVVPGLTREAERPALRRSRHPLLPRAARMRPSQCWRAVWPGPRTFHPAVVPLPIRQGRPNNATENAGISPFKWGNTELLKVPNFLHLTPAHVTAHCAAIRHLCTAWPEALRDPVVAARHLPIRIVTTDYVRATASIRDARARRVEISLPLDRLKKLDDRSREKLICLVGLSSYASVSPDCQQLRMWSDRCPWRFQNYDYLLYALSALYSQSLRLDAWEAGKEWRDNRLYEFAGSSSERKLARLSAKPPPAPAVAAYRAALRRLHRADEAGGGGGGESIETLQQYGRAVEKLLGLHVAGGGGGGHDGPAKKSPPPHKGGHERSRHGPSTSAPLPA